MTDAVVHVAFAQRLLQWYDRAGRRDLPWQHPRTPYRVWVAEIMLQQTQVATVIPYFKRFTARFPSVASLAAAPLDDVLALWSGLGYYARGRNLHAAARQLVKVNDGALPDHMEAWLALPGIGRSTAGAILAQAFGQRQPILDGNVRRVLARHAGIEGWPGKSTVAIRLWALAEKYLPESRLADYTQAQMDLGATLCTMRQPRCPECPVAEDCTARMQGLIARLPTPRPKRARPRRSFLLLLLRDADGRWLLERRQPAGLWGGLWSPPLVESRQSAARTAACKRLGVVNGRWRRLTPVDHALTHFDMRLYPVFSDARVSNRVADAQAKWLTIGEVQALGLPTPVRRLFCQSPDLRS